MGRNVALRACWPHLTSLRSLSSALPSGTVLLLCPAMDLLLGRRQVVRHLILVQAFVGSNPSAPTQKSTKSLSEHSRPLANLTSV